MQVFLSDMVADSADVKTMQDTLSALASDRAAKQASKLIKLKTPDNSKHWFRMNVYKQEDDSGLAEKMIITFNDVDEEVIANDKLLSKATRDPLTGLYNRAGFIEKAAELIASKEPGYYVMACVDIEKFTVINDTQGHAAGDHVLMDLTRKIAAILRHEDLIGRLGGDEFFVFLKDIGSREAAAAKAQQICALNIFVTDMETPVTASMGIALAPEDGRDFDTLYKKVDAALYSQKKRGKNGFMFVEE